MFPVNFMKRSVGIDLAGSERRRTGICILDEDLVAHTFLVFKDDEILSIVSNTDPGVVAIDAPLSIPKGRESIDDKKGPHFRECDLMLRDLGIKFFPITLGPMRMLTKRGMLLKEKLEKLGYRVIEVFPGGAQDLLGIVRKGKGLRLLREGLLGLGIKGIREDATGDELDAVTAAYVGLLFLNRKAMLLKGCDGCIVMPSVNYSKRSKSVFNT